MSPALLLLLAVLGAQDAAPAAASTPAPAVAAQDDEEPFPVGAPTDDYGLVSWCYGALQGHMALYEKVMPEVTRIEKETAKIPGAGPADLAAYEEQRKQGKPTLKIFRDAMTAAEKASAQPIQTRGAEALKKGGSIWLGANMANKSFLAREWMSWALPSRCVTTAQDLNAKANLFGQALNYNTEAAPSVTEVTPSTPTQGSPTQAVPDTTTAAPAEAPVTDPSAATDVAPTATEDTAAPAAEAAPPVKKPAAKKKKGSAKPALRPNAN